MPKISVEEFKKILDRGGSISEQFDWSPVLSALRAKTEPFTSGDVIAEGLVPKEKGSMAVSMHLRRWVEKGLLEKVKNESGRVFYLSPDLLE